MATKILLSDELLTNLFALFSLENGILEQLTERIIAVKPDSSMTTLYELMYNSFNVPPQYAEGFANSLLDLYKETTRLKYDVPTVIKELTEIGGAKQSIEASIPKINWEDVSRFLTGIFSSSLIIDSHLKHRGAGLIYTYENIFLNTNGLVFMVPFDTNTGDQSKLSSIVLCQLQINYLHGIDKRENISLTLTEGNLKILKDKITDLEEYAEKLKTEAQAKMVNMISSN